MQNTEPSSPNPSKSRLSSQERRAAIVDAALRLFAEKGFRGTTTRELAAAVGVSEPILYEHFKTKSDLYTAIIDAKSQQGMSEFATTVEHYLQGDDDLGFFTMLARAVLNWHIQDPAFLRLLLFSGLEGHELKDIFYQRQSSCFFKLIADYIERRMQQGAMRPMNPQIAARSFFGMIAQYGMARTIFSSCVLPVADDDVIRHQVDIFLNGVAKRDIGKHGSTSKE